jgi:hypothetical protein
MKLLVMRRQWLLDFAVVAVVYFLLAYVVLPALWKHHEHEPGLASLPMVTRTGTGIPGDPLNVGLVGSREDGCGRLVSGRPRHIAHESRDRRQRGA